MRLPAMTTVVMLSATTSATRRSPSAQPRKNAAQDMARPMAVLTPISRSSSFHQSPEPISPVAMARTTRVAAWAPALPPLPISSGMRATRAATATMVSSNILMPMPVKMLTTTRPTSQPMRLRNSRPSVASLKLICSGLTVASLWKSSVASSSATSRMSSTVTMPRSTPSESTTGRA